MTEEDRAALKKYQDVNINRRDVVQALRQELVRTGVVTASTRHAKDDRTQAICSELMTWSSVLGPLIPRGSG